MTPQAILEAVAALVVAAGKTIGKPQRPDATAFDGEFPDVLDDLIDLEDEPDPLQGKAPGAAGADPTLLLQATTFPVQAAPVQPPISEFGIEQVPEVEPVPETTGKMEMRVPIRQAADVAGNEFSIAAGVRHQFAAFSGAFQDPLEEKPRADRLYPTKRIPVASPVAGEAPGAGSAFPVLQMAEISAAEGREPAILEGPGVPVLEPERPDVDPSTAPRVRAGDENTGPGKVAFLAKLIPHTQSQPFTAEPHREGLTQPTAASVEAERKPQPKEAEPQLPAISTIQPSPAGAGTFVHVSPAMDSPRVELPAPVERGEAVQTVAETEPEPARLGATAVRDIRLQVSGGEDRVELRLTERGGEVHVAVRTPNPHLAGQLRDSLPVLTSRLEHTGFHTETWQPVTPTERTVEAGLRNSRPESGPDTNRRGHESPQQDAREQQKPQTPKQKGKQFAWLMSSLR